MSGARVYLYAVSLTEQNGTSASVLDSPGYVTTDVNGNFSITLDYTCPTGAYVYLLATGGNPGLTAGTNNAKLALGAGLGACSSLTAASSFEINEVSTLAMAYALSEFATTETTIGAKPAFLKGIQNAFGNIPNLVDTAQGLALTKTPAGNGIVPQTTLNSLANSIAACVNSDGTGTACSKLMTAANVSSGNGPVDTFQAALNIVHAPGVNVTNIYNLATPNSPFQNTLGSAPNDWTITIQYSGEPNPRLAASPNSCYAPFPQGGPFTDICQAQSLAVDGKGNVWMSIYNPDSNGGNGAVSFEQGDVVEFSPAGAEISPPGGYTAAYLYRLQQLAIDLAGNAWVGSRATTVGATNFPDSLVKVTPAGVVTSYTGGGIFKPRGVSIDSYGNVWTAGPGVLAEFTSAGAPVSGSGYTSSDLLSGTFKMDFDSLGNAWIVSYDNNFAGQVTEFVPVSHAMNLGGTYGGSFTKNLPTGGAINQGLAIDASNNIWFSNAFSSYSGGNFNGTGFVGEYSNDGTLLSGSGDTNGGILYPNDVAIDGSGNVFGIDSPLGEISNTGTGIAPASGYTSPNANDCCFTGAVDSSGNLWLTGGIGLYQMIGIATPVVTPLVANLGPG